MANHEKMQLKERVINFLKGKPFYKPSEELNVICDEEKQYFILYGPDVQSGVVGIGPSISSAYNNFVYNWDFYDKRHSKSF